MKQNYNSKTHGPRDAHSTRDRMFISEIPPKQAELINDPRLEVELKVEKLVLRETLSQSQRMSGVIQWKYLKAQETSRYLIALLFSGNDCFFVKRIKETDLVKRSEWYDSLDKAKYALHHGNIRWEKKVYSGVSVPNTS